MTAITFAAIPNELGYDGCLARFDRFNIMLPRPETLQFYSVWVSVGGPASTNYANGHHQLIVLGLIAVIKGEGQGFWLNIALGIIGAIEGVLAPRALPA